MTDLTDLAYLPATEALHRFRDRSLSPVELMTAVIARAEAVEPKINALAERTFEEALAAARVAEARYGGKGRHLALWRVSRSPRRRSSPSRAAAARTAPWRSGRRSPSRRTR